MAAHCREAGYNLLDLNRALSDLQTRLTDMLKATELQPEDIQGLLRLRATASALDSSNLRIDLAPYHYVHWVNNLEKVCEGCKPTCKQSAKFQPHTSKVQCFRN